MHRRDQDQQRLRPLIRGIYAFEDEETPEWRDVVLNGGIPKFDTKEQCEDFLRRYCSRGSNPEFPYLQHIFTMLVDEKQIRDYLLPKIEEYDRKYPPIQPEPLSPKNRFVRAEGIKVLDGIEERLNLDFHRAMNRESTMNTLWYLFNHMRCGLFVMIRRRKVVLFAPFVNKNYRNNWGETVQFDCEDGRMDTYYKGWYTKHLDMILNTDCQQKNETFIDEKMLFLIRINGGRMATVRGHESSVNFNANMYGTVVICNEHCRPNVRREETQFWGDQFLSQMRDMLEDACQTRDIPDCEFFINKRDYPHLKANLSEPYGFIFDRDDRNPDDDLPLTREKYSTYAPIMSFYISKRFADIPFPCSEDWEAATGCVFPPSFSHSHCRACDCRNEMNCQKQWECFCANKYHGVKNARDLFTAENFKKFAKPWEEKVNTAFFRGTATGGGTTIEKNQRLHLAFTSNGWKKDNRYNGNDGSAPFLDAEVTAWNLRDKKIAGERMTFLRPSNFKFSAGKHHYIPIYDQSKYKYILYVEGHCAANRYAFLLRLGSVILKVTSKCVADEMWYFPLLQPFVDHVPIAEDLSDLAEKIQWCRDNDEKCREIAAKANELYEEYVGKEAIRDYMELICTEIAQRYTKAPSWYTRPESPKAKPQAEPPRSKCVSHQSAERDCRRCMERKANGERPSNYSRASSSNDYHDSRPEKRSRVARCRKCRRATTRCIC